MSETFPKAKFLQRGYDREEVDEFFDIARSAYEGGVPAEEFSYPQVQQAAFELVRGGYRTTEVDAALTRLESAFLQRDRADFIAVNGETEWFSQTSERATDLYPRLLRPRGERFSHPKSGKGYNTEEVDDLLDRLTGYFDQEEELDPRDIRGALFKSARRKKSYDEAQVDAFLAVAASVLMSVQ
jgi:DivIVA domain repeat protein